MRPNPVLVVLALPIVIALATPEASSQANYFEPTRLLTQDTPSTSPLTPPLYNFQEVLGDERRLHEVLRMMRDDLAEDLTLADMTEEIRAGGGQNPEIVSRGLSGIGGIFGHAMLKAAEARRLDPARPVTIDSRGHIDGYFFDHQQGGGYLHVTTEITVGYPNGNVDVDRYRFEVEIGNDTFRVIEKDTSDPDDVFPGTELPISAEMAAGFNYKLWAHGTEIRVTRLWVDHNNNGIFEPNERVTMADHGDWRDGYRHLLEVDEDACIDMMFVHYPPETLPPGAAPPFYCLGRCANPPLINTK
jgi:hypothetical protein